ncbi:MAG TPA: hypothetical protein VE978_19445 [Chitinophagales bacterium]|nr:hypothetical protein [Chitinophagales bacterium]
MKTDKSFNKQQHRSSNSMDNIFLIHSSNEITRLNKGMSKNDVQHIFGGTLNLIEEKHESSDDIWLCTFGRHQKSKMYKLLFIDDKLEWAIRLG